MNRKYQTAEKNLIEKLSEQGIDMSSITHILDTMRQEVGTKKFGLVWENHPEKIEQDLTTHFPVFTEVKERRIDAGYGHTNNMLIEGDNLESLIAMRNIGKKVDVIYIDPPYNTGNEFVYNDKIIGKEDEWRHSKWLSFMEKRLKVARDLMNDDGVIFVSIDDNEQAHLKVLMDEVFGAENFIANVVVENNPKGRKNAKYFAYSHEYLLVYSKSLLLKPFLETIIPVDNGTQLEDSKGIYKHGKRILVGADSNIHVSDVNSNKNYDVLYKEKTNELLCLRRQMDGSYIDDIDLTDGVVYKNINVKTGHINYATYTWDKLYDLFKNEDLIFKSNTIYEKSRKIEVRIKSLLSKQSTGGIDLLTETSGRYVSEIIGDNKFQFPKNINFIKLILGLVSNKNATVLDFFAGSGTTGHAVLELNKEDGGHRQFILCTNNENNICEDVTYERLKRVINGYTTPKGKEVAGLPANLLYLKTELNDNQNTDITFDMSEEQLLLKHAMTSLKIKHHLHNAEQLSDNLYRLKNGSTYHYIYPEDYIDEDITAIELTSEKRHVIHVDSTLMNDIHLKKFDDVRPLQRLFKNY